jgi:tetraacyldisaccharide 4'-kinase
MRDGDPAESLWYSPSARAAAARLALSPLSLLFGAGVRVRSGLYDAGLVATRSAPAPVVSVGSLRVGGAGKTPFVLWVARTLAQRGRRPCLVTRGYGSKADHDRPWVVDASAAAAAGAAARAGDEAVMLALRSGLPVAIGADRAAACATATGVLAATGAAPDVFVLDDGFQHRRLARDLDIVLVSGREADERLLPAGPLREPASALARAGVVVVMHEATGMPARATPAGVAPSALVVGASAVATGLVADVADEVARPVDELRGRRVVAVAAIARPERFLGELRRAGAEVVATILRRDHHGYDAADRREIEAASAAADLVVTTEKDLVKLARPASGTREAMRAPLAALRIDVAFASEADEERLASLVAGVAAI